MESDWTTGAGGKVLAQFYEYVNASLVTLAMSRRGLVHVYNEFSAWQHAKGNDPDPYISIGTDTPDKANIYGHASVRRSTFFELMDMDDGQALTLLGTQWIVSTHAMWEEKFRPNIAASAGIPRNDVKLDVMGDLRHMRNDIVHHKGIGSRDNTGKARVLKWCKIGKPVTLPPERVPEMLAHFPNWPFRPWGPSHGRP